MLRGKNTQMQVGVEAKMLKDKKAQRKNGAKAKRRKGKSRAVICINIAALRDFYLRWAIMRDSYGARINLISRK